MGIPKLLCPEDKTYILTRVWGRPSAAVSQDLDRFAFYFDRYNNFCEFMRPESLEHLSHQDLADLARVMLHESKKRCVDHLARLCVSIEKRDVDDEYVDYVLDFVANLFFCLEGVAGPDWVATDLLRDRLADVFPHSDIDERSHLKRRFNLRTIERITDINVSWTGALNQHLELSDDGRDVQAFHCIAALDLFEASPTAQGFFPQRLIRETQQSLALMCPSEDTRVKHWLKKQQTRCKLDPNLCSLNNTFKLGANGRRLGHYDFWRERLSILKDEYEECEPRTALQLWRDSRRPMQRWMLWIALTAFFLSLFACIMGALEVVKAWHPSKAD